MKQRNEIIWDDKYEVSLVMNSGTPRTFFVVVKSVIKHKHQDLMTAHRFYQDEILQAIRPGMRP